MADLHTADIQPAKSDMSQPPSDEPHHHYVRTRARVHRYVDDTLGVFHGPRKLAAYDAKGTQTSSAIACTNPTCGRWSSLLLEGAEPRQIDTAVESVGLAVGP